MKSKIWPHIDAEGGDALLALRNIVCHFNVLLTDEQKATINWHPEQSVSLAVMRVLSDLSSDRAVKEPEQRKHAADCPAVTGPTFNPDICRCHFSVAVREATAEAFDRYDSADKGGR